MSDPDSLLMHEGLTVGTLAKPGRPSLAGVLRLSGIGALIGGLLGTGVLTGLLSEGFRQLTVVDLQFGFVFGGMVGALAAAVMAPLLGWVLLRPVPLWRALGWCAAGTVVAAVGGRHNCTIRALGPDLWRARGSHLRIAGGPP